MLLGALIGGLLVLHVAIAAALAAHLLSRTAAPWTRA
jgi:hypothetical protein